MSDWVMRDWRVPPRARHAIAFLVAAVAVSSMMTGVSTTTIPSEAGFDDDQVLLVAENRLCAVEALWVDYSGIDRRDLYDDLPDIEDNSRDYRYPTDDQSLRWIVRYYFELEAERKEVLRYGHGSWNDPEGLRDEIDYAFGRMSRSGTYSSWELRFNGTRIHFGSDTVEDPDLVPETCWTVSHDYSGEIGWPSRHEMIPYRAKLVFHLWFETERPEF